MSSDHRAQAPLTKPSEELADEDNCVTIISPGSHVSIRGLNSLFSGEPSASKKPCEARWIVLETIVDKAVELKNVHKFHPLKAYPVVSIGDKEGTTFYASEERTPVDLDGGSCPVWNTYGQFIIDIDEALQKNLYLFVTVKSKSTLSCLHGRFVGEVSVAIEDLLNNFGDAVDCWKLVKLRTKNEKGKEQKHGSVTFKYKFGGIHNPQPTDPLPLPADDPLPQSANGNPMDQMCNNNSQSILKGAVAKGAVGGVTSGVIETLGELILDSL